MSCRCQGHDEQDPVLAFRDGFDCCVDRIHLVVTRPSPLVKLTSSRICIIPSQPARLTAGPMNLEQSVALAEVLLVHKVRSVSFEWALGVDHGGDLIFTHSLTEFCHLIKR
jgi:hypothetical protein